MDAFAQFYRGVFAGDFYQPSCDEVAFLVLGEKIVEARGNHLLDAEAELAFFLVDQMPWWMSATCRLPARWTMEVCGV